MNQKGILMTNSNHNQCDTAETKTPRLACSETQRTRDQQSLRLKRFIMALGTYAFVILVAALVTILGIDKMNSTCWMILIGTAVTGNAIFYLLFRTGMNLRFPEPSLTREQILFSSLWGLIILYSLPGARPIVLMFYLPSFSFGMLVLTRRQFFFVEACILTFYAAVLFLEYIHNRSGFRLEYELFLFVFYGILLTWFAFYGGFISTLRKRLQAQKQEIQTAHDKIKTEIEERKKTQNEKDVLIVELKDALSKVRTLRGLLPICSSCKKIRDDSGYWNQIESYIRDHSDAEFSHGLCPHCAAELYPDLYKE